MLRLGLSTCLVLSWCLSLPWSTIGPFCWFLCRSFWHGPSLWRGWERWCGLCLLTSSDLCDSVAAVCWCVVRWPALASRCETSCPCSCNRTRCRPQWHLADSRSKEGSSGRRNVNMKLNKVSYLTNLYSLLVTVSTFEAIDMCFEVVPCIHAYCWFVKTHNACDSLLYLHNILWS